MKQVVLLFAVAVLCAQAAQAGAKNIILFLGDAGGIPTLQLASIHRYNDPQALFIQKMPHIALMDTSAADSWVTDSAAGMTAIVTGQKTRNGVISQSAAAVRGKQDGEVLKTVLEYAEERGLSTGVLTNMKITDATTAACYAHSNDRRASGAIFSQVFTPRFGDGVDVVIGFGRDAVTEEMATLGHQLGASAREKGYVLRESVSDIQPGDKRVIALLNTHDFDVADATQRAIRVLSQNKKGYFLMVEWDAHVDNLPRGLKQALELDDTIRKTAASASKDTLIIYAADHSFDARLRGGQKGQPLLPPGTTAQTSKNVRVDDGHTGEQVLVSAQGPGAERVRGFILNTDLFRIMMAAFGWEKWDSRRAVAAPQF